MRLSFNFPEYRKKTAKELVDVHATEGAEAARIKLNEIKQDEQYVIAKKIRNKFGTIESTRTTEELQYYQELVKEYGFVVRDISLDIPPAIKQYIDYIRLGAKPWDEDKKKFYSNEFYEKTVSDFFNAASKGKYYDKASLTHSIYGDEGLNNTNNFLANKNVLRKTNNIEIPLFMQDLKENYIPDFAVGKNSFAEKPTKELVIVNKNNPNFEALLFFNMVNEIKKYRDGGTRWDDKKERYGVRELSEEYIAQAQSILNNKQKILDTILHNQDVEAKLKNLWFDKDGIADEDGLSLGMSSSLFQSLLLLQGYKIDVGYYEAKRFSIEDFKMLEAVLGRPVKFIDIANTVVDLVDEKVYTYVGKENYTTSETTI